MRFETVVFSLCFLTSAACAGLLARAFLRQRVRLLLTSAICFIFLALNNLLVVVDLLLLPDIDLLLWRQVAALFAVIVLLAGFVWDTQ